MVWRNVAQKLVKCCEGQEGDDGDRKQVHTYFGKRFAKVYLVCLIMTKLATNKAVARCVLMVCHQCLVILVNLYEECDDPISQPVMCNHWLETKLGFCGIRGLRRIKSINGNQTTFADKQKRFLGSQCVQNAFVIEGVSYCVVTVPCVDGVFIAVPTVKNQRGSHNTSGESTLSSNTPLTTHQRVDV